MAGTEWVVVVVNSGACRRIGPDALRIGYQKGSVSMVLAKSHQLLEKRYPQTKISWVEFPAGPQMLEALNIGSIDPAAPVIFRQFSPGLPEPIWFTWASSRPSRKPK